MTRAEATERHPSAEDLSANRSRISGIEAVGPRPSEGPAGEERRRRDMAENIVEVSREQCGAAQGRRSWAPAKRVSSEACPEACAQRTTGGARRSIPALQPAEARMTY